MYLPTKQLGIFAGILIFSLIVLLGQMQKLLPTTVLQVSFLDVGQGDSIYIRTPYGNDIIIDGGPEITLSELQNPRHAFLREGPLDH